MWKRMLIMLVVFCGLILSSTDANAGWRRRAYYRGGYYGGPVAYGSYYRPYYGAYNRPYYGNYGYGGYGAYGPAYYGGGYGGGYYGAGYAPGIGLGIGVY